MDAELKTLVEELNRIRLDDNRSYADMATEIGIDPGALYKILNARSDPYDRTLHKIRRWLDEREKPPVLPRRRAAAR